MITQLEALGKAEVKFREALNFVEEASRSGLRIDEVERALFKMLLEAGRETLQAFILAAGDGDQGEVVEIGGKVLQRSEERRPKPYRSIFGVLSVERFVYAAGAKKKAEWLPTDARLGLPAGEQSYVLEDWLLRICVKESFAEAAGSLHDLLGVNTSARAAEVMTRCAAAHVEPFSDSQAPGRGVEEGEILVLTADGKGIPMRRSLEVRLREHQAATSDLPSDFAELVAVAARPVATPKVAKKRLKPGEKRSRKQMAYLGAVYSIAPFVRTAEEIVDEFRRQQRQADRPRPQNKQVFAEMTRFHEDEIVNGQVRCFARLAQQAIFRGSGKTIVCLMDGQRSLWTLKESWMPRAVGVLDIFHVLERLWQVAHAFHGEKAPAAQQQVDRHLRLLLEGQVSDVIGLYQRMLNASNLRGGAKKTVRETITYFRNNKQYMKYDEYLAKGYPIGTGVVEGACRHFVKDRMELAGMRWEIEGAQAMLSLRAVYLNDQWAEFMSHRIESEQATLYAQAA